MTDWIGNHLWQSTLFAAAASLLTLVFRKNHAHIRYWLWLAASLKFLIPFALFIEIGSSLTFSLRQSPVVQKTAVPYFENVSQPFGSIYFTAAIVRVILPRVANLHKVKP